MFAMSTRSTRISNIVDTKTTRVLQASPSLSPSLSLSLSLSLSVSSTGNYIVGKSGSPQAVLYCA